jgi:hypothetical protein
MSTENDNNFGYEKITIVVDNIPFNHDQTKMYARFKAPSNETLNQC